jgi:predicted membrane chloride channel (bestrophin family)
MTRTFLFLYVFTVPFVLLSDPSSLMAHCFIVFLLTYGFVGLEVVSIELDNPFGNDANDFNNAAMALTAYEDCYLTILDVDGPEWTDRLHARMQHPSSSLPSRTTTVASEVMPLL